MTHGGLAQFAAVLGAVGIALILLPLRQRALLFVGFACLGTAEVGLGIALVPQHDLRRLESPALLAELVVASVFVVALAALFVRRPALVPPAVLLAAPFRIPVNLGSQRAFLLLPLYAVLASCVLALVYREARGRTAAQLPVWFAATTTALMALDAVSLLWAEDLHQGSIELGFFIFPFAALVAVVARSPFPEWMPRVLGTILVALSSFFAVIGLWQAATHRVFFAHDLAVANAYTTFFRVTSLFKDPSLFGRYLVFGMVVVLVALWTRRLNFWIAAAVTALLFAGLYFSYSQSSMVTLFVLTVAIVLAAGNRQTRRTVVIAFVVFTLLAGTAFVFTARHHSARHYTSGRWRLIDVTLPVIRHHPIVGVGVGSQPVASQAYTAKHAIASRNASHTTPLTVASELGIVGLLVYTAFLVAAAQLLIAIARRNRPLGLGLTAVFGAVFVHALFYSGFFEDPIMWGTLAVAAAALATPDPAPTA
jgi:hypothetical protein